MHYNITAGTKRHFKVNREPNNFIFAIFTLVLIETNKAVKMTSVFPKTFFVQFKGISKLDSNTEHSSKLFSGNVMWQLKIKKTYEVEEKWLGVYLELFAPELNDASSYKVKFSIALLDATQENEIEKCSEESVFSKSKTSYGFDHFIEWDKLTEAGNDYVKCDAIFLKITLHEVHDAALNGNSRDEIGWAEQQGS